jgi:hypothetical protein
LVPVAYTARYDPAMSKVLPAIVAVFLVAAGLIAHIVKVGPDFGTVVGVAIAVVVFIGITVTVLVAEVE